MNGAYVRVALRYGVGILFGMEVGEMFADDPDIVMIATLAAGFVVNEGWYWLAKRYGWKT